MTLPTEDAEGIQQLSALQACYYSSTPGPAGPLSMLIALLPSLNKPAQLHGHSTCAWWHERRAATAALETELLLSCIHLSNAINLAFFVTILTL